MQGPQACTFHSRHIQPQLDRLLNATGRNSKQTHHQRNVSSNKWVTQSILKRLLGEHDFSGVKALQLGVNNTGSTRSIHCVDRENCPGNWHFVGWLRNPWSLSSSPLLFWVPSGKILSTLDKRVFCYAAPKFWNNLPSEISSLDSLSNFKCHWKHIFLNKLLICSSVFVSFTLLFITYRCFISFLYLSTSLSILFIFSLLLNSLNGKLRYISLNNYHYFINVTHR